MPSACDVLPNDQTSQEIITKKSKQTKKSSKSKLTNDNVHENGFNEDLNNAIDDKNDNKSEESNSKDELDKSKNDQELIFIHDTGFNIKISCPSIETFDLQVINYYFY